MKKTVALLTVMLVIAVVFFCVPVKAATVHTRLNYMQRVSSSQTNSTTGIQMQVTVNVFYPESYSAMSGGSVSVMMITAKIYNPNTQAGFVYYPTLDFVFSADTSNALPYITDIDNQSPDLYIGDNFNNSGSIQTLRILPSAAYNRGDGIVIPPGSTLYLVSNIEVNAPYVVSSNIVQVPVLSSVTISAPAFALGDYSYSGEPTDLSFLQPVIESIDSDTANIVTLLDRIKNELIPNAAILSPANNTPQYVTKALTTGITYFYSTLSIYTGNSYLDLDSVSHYDDYHEFERVVPITISYAQENFYQYAVAQNGATTNTALVISDLLPRDPNISYEIGPYESAVYNIPRIGDLGSGSYDILVFDYKMAAQPPGGGAHQGLVPSGSNFSTFTILAHIRGNTQFAINTDFTVSNTYTYRVTDIYLKSTDLMISDIYDWLKNSESQDLTDQSDDLTEDLNDAHTAEQNYFESNSQALAASGISNPNFEAADRTGINSAIAGNRNQFGLLWNAIGPWRNVYIYAALMALVTYLLRHKPWISGGKRRYEQHQGGNGQ